MNGVMERCMLHNSCCIVKSGIIFQAAVSNLLLTVREKKKEYELLQLLLKMKELVSTLLDVF